MGPWRDTLENCMWQRVAKKRQGAGSLTPRSRVSWTMRKWVSAACGKGYGSPVQLRQSVMGIQALIWHVFVLWEISGEGWKAARQGYAEFSRDRMLVIQERCNKGQGDLPDDEQGVGNDTAGQRGGRVTFQATAQLVPLDLRASSMAEHVWLNICLVKHTCGHNSEECGPQSSTRQEMVCKSGVSSHETQKVSKSKNPVASHV